MKAGTENDPNAALSRRYSAIWSSFARGIEAGERAAESGASVDEFAEQSQLSCLISVQEFPAMMEGLRKVQALLGSQPALVLHEPGFWHITVRMFGIALGDCSEDGCDVRDYAGRLFSSYDLRATLRECVAHVPAFPVELCGLNAWLNATFVQTFDAGGIATLRQCIQGALPELSDRGYPDGFVPHLTLGFHRPGADLSGLLPALSRLRDLPLGHFTAGSVQLVWGRAALPHPELVTLGTFRLR